MFVNTRQWSYGKIMFSVISVCSEGAHVQSPGPLSVQESGPPEHVQTGWNLKLFTNSPQYKNANIVNFILAVPLGMN